MNAPGATAGKAAGQRVLAVVGVLALLSLGACVAGSAESQHAASGGLLSQLLLGFWHGLIAPVMLILEVIEKLAPHVLPWNVGFYESHSPSVAYDVGFYFGLVGSPVLIGAGYRRRRD